MPTVCTADRGRRWLLQTRKGPSSDTQSAGTSILATPSCGDKRVLLKPCSALQQPPEAPRGGRPMGHPQHGCSGGKGNPQPQRAMACTPALDPAPVVAGPGWPRPPLPHRHPLGTQRLWGHSSASTRTGLRSPGPRPLGPRRVTWGGRLELFPPADLGRAAGTGGEKQFSGGLVTAPSSGPPVCLTAQPWPGHQPVQQG